MALACHVISQNHLTNGGSNIMGRNFLLQVTNLPSLVAIDTVAVEI